MNRKFLSAFTAACIAFEAWQLKSAASTEKLAEAGTCESCELCPYGLMWMQKESAGYELTRRLRVPAR